MLRFRLAAALAAMVLLLSGNDALADNELRFSSPVVCPAGLGCVVRSFVDLDATDEAHDQNCGNLTYDGHKGVDIRVPDSTVMMRGVKVLASAPGVVAATRDEMPDISVRLIDRATIENRAGGNAVVIDHGNGWSTHYWHLRQGSIRVKKGQVVRVGQAIGMIGLSGDTEFLHLHFEIRQGDTRFDPYSGLPLGGGCGKPAHPLWTETALAQLPYRAEAPFDAGFATGEVDFAAAHAGAYAADSLSIDVPALVFWAEVLGSRAGDEETIRLIAPDGTALVDKTATLDDTKVQRSRFAGVRRPESGWAPGIHRGEYIVRRKEGGQTKTVVEITREIELR